MVCRCSKEWINKIYYTGKAIELVGLIVFATIPDGIANCDAVQYWCWVLAAGSFFPFLLCLAVVGGSLQLYASFQRGEITISPAIHLAIYIYEAIALVFYQGWMSLALYLLSSARCTQVPQATTALVVGIIYIQLLSWRNLAYFMAALCSDE